MAKKLAGGSSSNTKDTAGKRRGVKKYGGEYVRNGNIIVRQVGAKFKPYLNTKISRDYTIYAVSDGFVRFQKKNNRSLISVIKC